jgi:hypothetical protein
MYIRTEIKIGYITKKTANNEYYPTPFVDILHIPPKFPIESKFISANIIETI